MAECKFLCVSGIGNSAIYGNCLVMLGVYFRKRKTLANGLALAGSSIGQFALPPVIEYLLETYSLHGSILLVGSLACLPLGCLVDFETA